MANYAVFTYHNSDHYRKRVRHETASIRGAKIVYNRLVRNELGKGDCTGVEWEKTS